MIGVQTAQPETGLALRLRAGTRRAHRWIERLAVVRSMLRGVLNIHQYQRLLLDLHAVYGALESELRAQQLRPAVAPLVLPALFRHAAIADDLDFLVRRVRSDWRMMPISAAALRYCQRLRQISERSPELLAAHCYTRYLGDLSGGPILRRMAGLALGLDRSGGLAYYDFPEIADVAAFKKDFRQRIDGLPLSEDQRCQVIAEAVRAFELSGALFETLSVPVLRQPHAEIVARI